MYVYAARLSRVVDGDTLDVLADLGFHIQIHERVRLLGVNCPEHGSPAGDAATAFTTQWLAENGPDLILRTELDKTEKYGRILGTITAGARTLNADLVAAGHAVDYDGGRRTVPLPEQPGEPDHAQPVR
jgi:endonuclease YncB( thermonuclease family)